MHWRNYNTFKEELSGELPSANFFKKFIKTSFRTLNFLTPVKQKYV